MCDICGKPVDRSQWHVSVVWSPEMVAAGSIIPAGPEELILFHDACAPSRANFKARISYR